MCVGVVVSAKRGQTQDTTGGHSQKRRCCLSWRAVAELASAADVVSVDQKRTKPSGPLGHKSRPVVTVRSGTDLAKCASMYEQRRPIHRARGVAVVSGQERTSPYVLSQMGCPLHTVGTAWQLQVGVGAMLVMSPRSQTERGKRPRDGASVGCQIPGGHVPHPGIRCLEGIPGNGCSTVLFVLILMFHLACPAITVLTVIL